MTKNKLKSILIEICEYDEDYVNSLDDRDLFDKYLMYEGIIGFTNEIIDTCKHLNFDD